MSGKGDKRRPQYITDYENNLRWELLKASDADKQSILDQLEQIKTSMPIPNEKDKMQ